MRPTSLAEAVTAPFKVTAIVATYNEVDIVAATIGDLVAQGIFVIVLDDGSTDGTREALEPFVSRGVALVEDLEAGEPAGAAQRTFSLRHIIERKQKIAIDFDSTWFINHDADEFRESPWTGVDLVEGIRRVDALGYNAIDFELFNFWPTDDDFVPGGDPRPALPYFDPGGDWDKLQIRCWKRSAVVDLVSSAGHEAVFPGRRVFPIRFLLRHYPFRGQAHGERKLFRERRPRYAPEELRAGWHVQYASIADGHHFVRDAAALRRFEPDRERIRLQIENRRVEELAGGATVVRLREDSAARESALLHREVDRLARALQTIEGELHARSAELEQLHRTSDATNRQLDELQRSLHAANLALEAARREVDHRQGANEELRASHHAANLALEAARQETADVQALLHEGNLDREARERELDRLNRALESVHASLHQANLERESLHRDLDESNRQLLAQRAELDRLRASRPVRLQAWWSRRTGGDRR